MNDNRRRGIIKFTWDRGSKFGAKKLGSAMKKYTWLRPCRPLPPPPIFRPNEGSKGGKKFFGDRPPAPLLTFNVKLQITR